MTTPSDTPSAAPGHTFPALVAVMKRLLSPDGCPWDREQTLESLRPYLLEETYEVLDAMERDDAEEHCEELGDLLMQVAFQAELRELEGAFAIDDVVGSIVDKLTRRHPHVFADASADTSEEVLMQWSEIKAAEKAAKAARRGSDAPPPGVLDGVPLAMPALARAHQLGGRAARVGFDWPDATGPRDKVREELGELDEAMAAGDKDAIAAEVGDLLFAAVNLARKLGCDAEAALRASNQRFVNRFSYIEDQLRATDKSPRDSSPRELNELWDQAKIAGR